MPNGRHMVQPITINVYLDKKKSVNFEYNIIEVCFAHVINNALS